MVIYMERHKCDRVCMAAFYKVNFLFPEQETQPLLYLPPNIKLTSPHDKAMDILKDIFDKILD